MTGSLPMVAPMVATPSSPSEHERTNRKHSELAAVHSGLGVLKDDLGNLRTGTTWDASG